jgi:hypothetical protein
VSTRATRRSVSLGSAANAAERVFYLVGELPNHLSARTVLYEQRIFATDLRSPRDIGHFDEQRGITRRDR